MQEPVSQQYLLHRFVSFGTDGTRIVVEKTVAPPSKVHWPGPIDAVQQQEDEMNLMFATFPLHIVSKLRDIPALKIIDICMDLGRPPLVITSDV